MFHVDNILCEDLDVKAEGTVYSNVLNTGYEKIGDIEPLILEIWSADDAAGAEGLLDITLQTSTTEAFTTAIDVMSLPQKAAAALAKGKVFEGALPAGLKKYLRLKFVTSSSDTETPTYFTKALITAAIRNRG